MEKYLYLIIDTMSVFSASCDDDAIIYVRDFVTKENLIFGVDFVLRIGEFNSKGKFRLYRRQHRIYIN